MEMTVGEIARACGGKLLGGDPAALATSVETDSRQVRPGALFVPIKGAHTDAHRFLPAAFAAGAAAALTQEPQAAPAGKACIAVQDTAAALQAVAAAYRARFSVPIVGVTGSVGKTTTKEFIALALSARLRVMKTQGNQNSQIGVPGTLLQLDPQDQAAVVEMGMSEFGEMHRLAAMVRPQIALITNIGLSHIGNLHTQENIRAEKLHITDYMGEDGLLLLNGDDPLLAALRGAQLPCALRFFGTSQGCDWRAVDLRPQGEGTRFAVLHAGQRNEVFVPVSGPHQVMNALAAIATADALGIPAAQAAARIATYRPAAMRMQQRHVGGYTILDDSYNASPEALNSSLDVLCTHPGRHVAVLADMLQLGAYAQQAHTACGAHAARAGVDLLVTVGADARWIADGARSVRADFPCHSFADNASAAAFLKEALRPGDIVLVKGSRGMHTDEIVEALAPVQLDKKG